MRYIFAALALTILSGCATTMNDAATAVSEGGVREGVVTNNSPDPVFAEINNKTKVVPQQYFVFWELQAKTVNHIVITNEAGKKIREGDIEVPYAPNTKKFYQRRGRYFYTSWVF